MRLRQVRNQAAEVKIAGEIGRAGNHQVVLLLQTGVSVELRS